MVKLTFNAYGYSFQSGIDILLKSYTSAQQALENDVEMAADDAFAYQQSREEGGKFIGERDDDGYIIWDQQDVLNDQHEMAQDALRSLRRAFAISLYHHWERGARAWTNAKKGANHEDLVNGVEALGMKVHPNLQILRMIANLLKHDNDAWGQKVLNAAPTLIGGVTINVPDMTDWYQAVVISETWMTDFFNAVAASGPKIDTTWS
jgi:hypothetical protein